MSRVAVNEAVMNWAVNRSGFTVGELQDRFPKIRQWVVGESQPSLRQLESLSRVTLTPLGYFFLAEPPEEQLPVPHFRTHADGRPSQPSAELLETIHMMQRRQAWVREFLSEQGQEPLPIVRSARPRELPTSVVNRLRRMLGLDEDWASRQPSWTDALHVLREAMESAGLLVVINGVVGNNTRRKLNPGEFRGFVLVDEYAPLVFVNGADGKAAQMFTLAHELAHIAFGSSAAFDLRDMLPADDPTERACNQLAAEFLVPESELRPFWPSVQRALRPFQAIARHFKVSQLVAARRTLDLRLIQKAAFLEFYRAYQHEERRTAASRPAGGDFYATQNVRVGRRFAQAVVRAAREGKLLFSEAYRLTGLYGKSFDRYAASLGIDASR